MIARRFLIRGRVQAVGFRYFVVHAAEGLGVAGWTRNLSDGGVEVLAQAPADVIEALAAELAVGPRSARVDSIEASDEPVDPHLRSFGVRH